MIYWGRPWNPHEWHECWKGMRGTLGINRRDFLKLKDHLCWSGAYVVFWMVLVSPPSCIYTKTSLVNQLYQKDNKIHNLSLPLNRCGATPLATLLKTAVFVLFFLNFSWKEMPLLRRQTRGIFCIHINWKTFQTHTAALPQHQVRVKSAWKLSIVTADRTGKLVLLTYSLTASLSVKSWNYQKRRLKLQTVHACMYAFYFRTSLKCILKYRLWCNSRSQ